MRSSVSLLLRLLVSVEGEGLEGLGLGLFRSLSKESSLHFSKVLIEKKDLREI